MHSTVTYKISDIRSFQFGANSNYEIFPPFWLSLFRSALGSSGTNREQEWVTWQNRRPIKSGSRDTKLRPISGLYSYVMGMRLATWLRLRLPVSLPCRWVVYSEELGSSQPSEPSPWRESDKVKSEHLPCNKIYIHFILISLVEIHYLAKKLMTFLLRWDYWRVQRRWFCFSYPSPKTG